jgi:hypothetical protein
MKKKNKIKRASTLYQNNKKDILRASQKLSRPHPWQAQGWENVNSSRIFSFETRALGHPALTQSPNELFL